MMTRYAIIAAGQASVMLRPLTGAGWSLVWSDQPISHDSDEIMIVTSIWRLSIVRRYRTARVLSTLRSALVRPS